MSVIEMKMGAIYQAAHDVLPAKAADFSARADATSGAIDPIVAQLALAGNHPVAGDLADLSVELFVHLRSMVRTFNDSATALDAIADDFVGVDADAEAWFAQHQQYVGDPELAPEPTAPEV
ncbi:hypothetical protein IEZ26_11305 [Nocardioides cavernae]|uniref:PE domain-containing protein n=1 Tax=Nocardioides cavernae TaxID=1921566 RepID=A0ABR8NAR4_9ACTN|nr:hypothetical protein [Nocardioides cavernae]MBD3925212.1 hypothetical protein [Nocardioides cavernae]MBM7514409.1 ABC-type transporter Mla subunit MlaD [Nocardioides cavernae]